MSMVKRLALAALAIVGLAGASPAPEVKLWRLDCGSVVVNDLNAFSDTHAYTGRHKALTASCYLIKHGESYMLWDTGLPKELLGAKTSTTAPLSATLGVRLVDQLKTLGVSPSQIAMVGISHDHYDHIGQAADFAGAKLYIGKGDWDQMAAPTPGPGLQVARLEPWIHGGSAYEAVVGDKDLFGDGSVTMIDLPGHTPGHHGLLVRLQHAGNVLLSGDTYHFTEQVANHGVPPFNFSRSQTLASIDRFEQLAKNEKALVIIQHEPADIAKLPAFPKAAD